VFTIILPNIRFGIITAAFLSFVLSWEEIGARTIYQQHQRSTLPRMMWMSLRDNIDPAIAAIFIGIVMVAWS
jgi:putative spermidine/putrescine transport system permease protein